MASSSFSGSASAAAALPLLPCPFCQKMLVTRVCKNGPNAGKRFYKCTRMEHTPQACNFYKFEEDYEEWLQSLGWQRERRNEDEAGSFASMTDISRGRSDLKAAFNTLRSDVLRTQGMVRSNAIVVSRMLSLLVANTLVLIFIALLVWSK